MKPLRSQGLLSAEDTGAVFSNVEQLRILNGELLTSLQGVEELSPQDQDVGRRFACFVDFLKMYYQYCANQTTAVERLQELKKSKPQLPQALEVWELRLYARYDWSLTIARQPNQEIKNRPECNLLDLESFLIKPLQRVTKYPLLLKEILKHTETTHPDYARLDACYARIAEVVSGISSL